METEPTETKYENLKKENLSKFITYIANSINNIESQNCLDLLSTDFQLVNSTSKLFFETNKKLIKEKDEVLKNKIIRFTPTASLDLNLITDWDVCWNYFKEVITFYFLDISS